MNKALLHKSIGVGARRTPRAACGCYGHHRLPDTGIIERNHWQFITTQTRADHWLTVVCKTNIVLIPSGQLTAWAYGTLHIFEAAHSKIVVMNIVSSSPREFHRQPTAMRYSHGFCCKVVHCTPTKTATHAQTVYLDVFLLNAQHIFSNFLYLIRKLTT